jgi:uncharacterized protein YifE (UPF0438 family)
MASSGRKRPVHRRDKDFIQLNDSQELAVLKSERVRCAHMVEQFNRKGLHNTVWHNDLERIDNAIRKLEEKGEKQDD